MDTLRAKDNAEQREAIVNDFNDPNSAVRVLVISNDERSTIGDLRYICLGRRMLCSWLEDQSRSGPHSS